MVRVPADCDRVPELGYHLYLFRSFNSVIPDVLVITDIYMLLYYTLSVFKIVTEFSIVLDVIPTNHVCSECSITVVLKCLL